MLILKRAYNDCYDVIDTNIVSELRLSKEEIELIYKFGGGIMRIKGKGVLEKIKLEEFTDTLRNKESMLMCSDEKQVGGVAVYRKTPAYKNRTNAVNDIYVYAKGLQTTCLLALESVFIENGSSSTHFMDALYVEVASPQDTTLTCKLRKHDRVGHKSDDEYHATWIYKNGKWNKGAWEFIENCTGY